ncbi:MAG: sugar ABC transporter ATP-binding protein [Christensenellaceae bacterium]|nr:sugar ABC transporter ATP-binding protein [Christensenellaceae bacterium]
MAGVHKRFPGVYALKDVTFDLRPGEVHALLGENGAGKSTLIKILGGIHPIDEGEIEIDGQIVAIRGVQDAQRNHISIIHQELAQVPHMTVAENIFLGKELLGRFGTIRRDEMTARAQQLLDAYDLDVRAEQKLSNLTIAQRQMIEIIKAVSFNTRILVMDEPTSSLSDKEVEFVFKTIRRLKGEDVGIIYISHRLSELFEISDRVTVLRDGEVVGTRVTREATAVELINLMVGRELTNYYTRTFHPFGEEVLRLEHVSAGELVRDVSFAVRGGEILGLAGLVGAGRSEIMQVVFGLENVTSGELFMHGKPVTIASPNEAMALGIGLVPEDRKKEGIFPTKAVGFNITLKILKQIIRGLSVDSRLEDETITHYIDALSIKTPGPEQLIANLSGGNQQKVVIARWLATKPQVLILDEPTRGVDVGSKAEIYAIMNELAEQGVSIIMISSELPEIINMSDRVVVVGGGSVKGVLERDELSQEKIMMLATEGM